MPGAYLLPADAPLTRRITGTATGQYTFNSIIPDGASLALQDVTTATGQADVLSMNPNLTQVRFAPGTEKTFNVTIARQVGDQARVIAIRGISGSLKAQVEITTSLELAFARLGNPGTARNIEVQAIMFDGKNNKTLNKRLDAVNMASQSQLQIQVQNWDALDASLQISSQ